MTDDLVLEARHFAPAGSEVLALPLALPKITNVAPPMTPRAVPPAPGLPPESSAALQPLSERVAEVERVAIGAALRRSGGNRVAAAKLLGMSRAALYDRLARWPDLAGSA